MVGFKRWEWDYPHCGNDCARRIHTHHYINGMSRFTRPFENAFPPFQNDSTPQPPAELGAFLRWALGEFRWVLVGLGLATIAYGALDVWVAWYFGTLLDMAAKTGPEDFFAQHGWSVAFAAFVFCLLRPGAQILQSAFQSLSLGPNLSVRALWRLHRHTLGQTLGFFQDDFAGRIASKQMQTAGALVTATMDTIMALGLLSVYVVVMALVLIGTSWWLAMLTVIWFTALGIYITSQLKLIRASAKARAEARAGVNGRFVDSFTNFATVKLFAHEEREENYARNGLAHLHDKNLHFGRASMQVRIGLNIINTLGSALIIGLALWLWSEGRASIGELVAATTMILRATQMSGWVAWSAIGVFENIGTIEDGASTLAKEHGIVDADNAHALPSARAAVKGAIRFENVSFQYGRTVGGVSDLSLDIAPGERVGLVGRSGAGKSTIVSALLRLYDIEEGRILLDGHDIRALTQDSLRRQIAVVTQETAMFNRSAMDNILYGYPGDVSTPEAAQAARKAARQARADDFICDLTDPSGRSGFDAHIGERGVKLSGGQRQRIAIARALLKDAPILVLDEATSALDSEVEAEIQDELTGMMQGKTVIAIAHRLSTIAHLDRIVVLDAGRIVEDGTHEALLAKEGQYASFWNRQSGGFLNLAAE